MGHPTVEVTLLFTDIEGSTALAHELGDAYVDLLAQHNRIVRDAVGHFTGVEARNEGDAFFAVFDRAADAVSAALAMQRGFAEHPWQHGRPVRVRMGLHAGPAIRLLHDFAGLNVHLASRVATAAHGGQVVASQAVLDALPDGADFKWTELGAHLVKDFPEPITLYQLRADGLDTKFPPLNTIDARDHNLPAMVTSFVGRGDELAELRTLLSGEARLITLTGPGGVGKTRIAIEAAWSVLSRYRGGAWFVDLAPVADPGAIVDTIIGALGVRDRDHLIETFSEGRTLLVLDNLEQLLSGVVAISELLAACPKLVVLATTRERLRLQGEHEVVLDGLVDAEAVDLFAARASLVRRDFTADERVDVLCQRVGGLPLAIELAAARLRTHSIDQLVDAMDDMLATLAEGERDRPARHQAMRAAIAISVDALTEAERNVFRGFAVFGGGATTDAIGAVCAPKADEIESLVDKSLLRRRDDRITMLEPIRQFAEDRLRHDVAGELEQRVQAHAQYYFELAQRLEPDLITARQREALAELRADHANLRLAWERAEGDVPLRIAASLIRFWYGAFPYEGRAVLKRVLDAQPQGDPIARAKALVGAGQLAALQHDLDEARMLLGGAIEIGDASSSAIANNVLGDIARLAGDLDEADAYFEAAMRLAESVGDDRVVGLVRNNQSLAAFDRDDYGAAAEMAQKALTLAELTGDQQAATRAVGNLGRALMQAGELAKAQAAFERSLEMARATGDRGAEALAMRNIAASIQFASVPSGEFSGEALAIAARYVYGAVEVFDELGFKRPLAETLLGVAGITEDKIEIMRAVSRARAIFVELGDSAGISAADDVRAAVQNSH
ncbi:MAG: hypothetical protein QOG90_209 [Actinomycetota bacterium]|jgi:predicted ATPase/class 3 adenylate cyclase/Tfp pilus assembly protein PilF